MLQLLKLPDGTVKVLVEGVARAKVAELCRPHEFYEAERRGARRRRWRDKVEAEALARSVVTEFESYVKLNKKVSPEVVGVGRADRGLLQARRHGRLASGGQDFRQAGVLEISTVAERLEKVLGLMESEISVLQVEKTHPHAASSARWRRRSANTTSTSR
ncbi:MAG: hypothetical protein QM722_01395 [Piscinibacter sp.]